MSVIYYEQVVNLVADIHLFLVVFRLILLRWFLQNQILESKAEAPM